MRVHEYAQGADLESTDNSGVTPLQLAAHYGRIQIATRLIEKGAKINSDGEYATTALH
jgi:ankyrin repeat protein